MSNSRIISTNWYIYFNYWTLTRERWNYATFFIAFLFKPTFQKDMAVFIVAETRDDTTGWAHQASVYSRRILMRRVSRGGSANACTDIHKPNYPFSLCSIAVIWYSSALNNRGTAQFASFATKACEFNEKIIFIRKYRFLIDCVIPKTKTGGNENNVLFNN